MTSWIDISNQALTKIGHFDFINSMDEESKAAQLINKNYKQVRDYVLRLCHWNFARKRVILAPSTVSPEFGSRNYFPLPSDFIRLVSVNDDPSLQYSIENNGIFYDATSLNLLYIARIDDVNKYDPLFVEAVTARLAYVIAPGLTDSASSKKALIDDFNDSIIRARSVNGLDNGYESVLAESFLLSRG